jgi:hypothetical protein
MLCVFERESRDRQSLMGEIITVYRKIRSESLCWHVYVLVDAYFVWPWKTGEPSVTLTSHREHWPLLIRVSGITWRGSKLLEKLSFIRVTYCCYAYWLYFLTCDKYKSSLRHIHDSVLLSLKMKGIRLLFSRLSLLACLIQTNTADVLRVFFLKLWPVTIQKNTS